MIILIYAEFYAGELHFAQILRAAELSPSSSVIPLVHALQILEYLDVVRPSRMNKFSVRE